MRNVYTMPNHLLYATHSSTTRHHNDLCFVSSVSDYFLVSFGRSRRVSPIAVHRKWYKWCDLRMYTMSTRRHPVGTRRERKRFNVWLGRVKEQWTAIVIYSFFVEWRVVNDYKWFVTIDDQKRVVAVVELMILMSFRLQSNDKLEIYDLRIEQWLVQGVPLTVAAAGWINDLIALCNERSRLIASNRPRWRDIDFFCVFSQCRDM